MTRGEISEYPYYGVITRIIAGTGDEDDTRQTIYTGVMDEHLTTQVDGHVLQTASYVICIPLVEDSNGNYNVPHKGDEITLQRYGENINFVVDNADPSQLGGISVYCTRKAW